MDPEPLTQVADWLRNARSVVALTGAGISTESGIPDFRGPQGVWTRDPKAEALSDIRFYVADPELRKRAWQGRLNHPAHGAEPNAGHQALAEMERQGLLHALITQNIDGLHLVAGSSPQRTVEIHGTMRDYICLDCGSRGPMADALARVRAGEEDPACVDCGGILKSATISFGQSLVPADLARAEDAAAASDLFLAIGTSLTVYPVAWLPERALQSGARLVMINAQPTPLDGRAQAVLRGSIGEILPALLERVATLPT
ncbi:MAG TPA: Sir2 family NAD-dependent protein deacetylase [Candidatus Limnocylindrales bacterium]|nr:Sir2 family NAD-dependent protein deacetylase [Candidatus Limnocylindrales bacterium]